MTFWCDGLRYHTAGMRQFLTNDPSIPLVLLTEDYRRVFVMTLDGCNGSRIHQANTLEIISLASRHRIAELLKAFPASKVGEVRIEPSEWETSMALAQDEADEVAAAF